VFGGYCYLNNVAIAAQWFVDQGLKPAILDVDYHHGNGTQSIFYRRADVLFCSLHGDPSFAYPHFLGFADEAGEGGGEGSNLNLPMPMYTPAPHNPALLLEPQLGLGTSCYSLTSRDTTGKAYINYQARFVGWTPSRAWLTRAGASVSGFWPDTDAQFQAALQKAIPGGARGSVSYSAAKTPATETALRDRLAAIPECRK